MAHGPGTDGTGTSLVAYEPRTDRWSLLPKLPTLTNPSTHEVAPAELNGPPIFTGHQLILMGLNYFGSQQAGVLSYSLNYTP